MQRWSIYIFLSLLPFLQVGISFWISVQVLCAAIVLNEAIAYLTAGLVFKARRSILFVGFLFFPGLIIALDVGISDALRVLRECVIFFLLVLVVECWGCQTRGNVHVLGLPILVILLIQLLLTVVQAIYLLQGAYFGLPHEWFIANENTLPGELALKYSNVRPAGTYGEPSYLAFVSFSLCVIVLSLRKHRWMVYCCLAVFVSLCLTTQSGSAVLAASFVLASFLSDNRKKIHIYIGIALVAGGMVLFDLFSWIDNRLAGLGSVSGDYSIFVRIFGPLQILGGFLLDHPLGVPMGELPSILNNYAVGGTEGKEYLHNAWTNLLFAHGIFGPLIIVKLFSTVWAIPRISWYLLMVGMFNGGLLAVDKFSLIAFVILNSVNATSTSVQRRRF